MKKIKLSLSISIITFLITGTVLAQFGTKNTSDLDTKITLNNSKRAVLWDQATIGSAAVESIFLTDKNLGVYPADDFELTSEANITSIIAAGLHRPDNLLTASNYEGFSFFIYENDPNQNIPAGIPNTSGNALLEMSLAPNDPALLVERFNAQIYRVQIDITAVNGGKPLNLQPGKYWISIVCNQKDIPDATSTDIWQWIADFNSRRLSEPYLIDPDDFSEKGATSWTPFSDIGLTEQQYPGLGFAILGDNVLSTQDLSLSTMIYPNPTNGNLNIKTTNNVSVLSAIAYDMLGKKIPVSYNNETINLSHLNPGVYQILINTDFGTITRKVIKK